MTTPTPFNWDEVTTKILTVDIQGVGMAAVPSGYTILQSVSIAYQRIKGDPISADASKWEVTSFDRNILLLKIKQIQH